MHSGGESGAGACCGTKAESTGSRVVVAPKTTPPCGCVQGADLSVSEETEPGDTGNMVMPAPLLDLDALLRERGQKKRQKRRVVEDKKADGGLDVRRLVAELQERAPRVPTIDELRFERDRRRAGWGARMAALLEGKADPFLFEADGVWSGVARFGPGGGPWLWGDPAPAGATPCGWLMVGRTLRLLDPTPCAYPGGGPERRELGWYLSMGSTQTIAMPTGGYRMYFASARLSQVSTELTFEVWPIYDPGGREKFGINTDGFAIGDEDERDAWWRASGSDVTALHFSDEYVGWAESADGREWPIFAPKLSPVTGIYCDNASYAGATPVFEDGSFRAGWHSTSIRASGATVVYRDVSVVYLNSTLSPLAVPAIPPLLDVATMRYVMFAVECDGTGRASGVGDCVFEGDPLVLGDDVVEGGRAPICTPSGCLIDGTPKTRYVFFTCEDADFRENVRGPFPALPTDPDPAREQWIGVPQAFTSPDGRFLLFYVPGSDAVGNEYAERGLWMTRIDTFLAGVVRAEAALDAGADPAAIYGMYGRYLTALGAVAICGTTPGDVVDAVPDPTDEHFAFCADGRLHLYFSNRNSGDPGDALTLVSQAAASAVFDPEVVFEGCVGPPLFSIPTVDTSELYVAPDPENRRSLVELLGLESEDADGAYTLEEMLLSFKMTACNPVNMPWVLGADTVTSPTGVVNNVGVNDPNVYYMANGDLAMILHCSAVGGMLLLTAPNSVACIAGKCE